MATAQRYEQTSEEICIRMTKTEANALLREIQTVDENDARLIVAGIKRELLSALNSNW